MNIEFKTVYNELANEQLADLYVKHFMDKQNNQYKKMIIFVVALAIFAMVMGIATENYPLCISSPFYLVFGFIMIRRAKKKVLPKTFVEMNGIGCPYNVTFGLYDEYFYEKFENNMSIQESSIRYEFLKKVVETPEYFVLMTKRSQLFFLPKRDMGYEKSLEFSMFCKARIPYIYSFKG